MIKKGQQPKGTCRQLRGFQNRLDCAHVNMEGKVLGREVFEEDKRGCRLEHS